jgi:hypothetical protein
MAMNGIADVCFAEIIISVASLIGIVRYRRIAFANRLLQALVLIVELI